MKKIKKLSEKAKTLKLTGWSEKEYQSAYKKAQRIVSKGKNAGVFTPNLSPAKALRLSLQYPDTRGGIREKMEGVASAKDPIEWDAEQRIARTSELAKVLPRLQELIDLYRDGTLTATDFVEAHRAFMSGYDVYRKKKDLSPLDYYSYMS